MKTIDLHSHTQASDGLLSPSELVERAVEQKVDVLAITDHDSVAGLSEAQSAAREINRDSQTIEVINGIEISTGWQGFDIHVVGLNIDPQNPDLLSYLERQKALRDERAVEMGSRLEKARIPGVYEEAKAIAGEASITRSHFAQVLLERGYATSFNKVFDNFLAKGKTGYMPNNWPEIPQAVEVIHQAGGLAVLAHPSHYKLSTKWLRRLLTFFKESGGDAMEVVGCQQSKQERDLLTQLCVQYELLASQGSDFHRPTPWCELGRNLELPEQLKPVWQSWS